ncbi:hypothetical protein [Psychrobacillus sp. FJAT-51614]
MYNRLIDKPNCQYFLGVGFDELKKVMKSNPRFKNSKAAGIKEI